MSNRIIVPARYTFELIIKVDPRNGQSELEVKNRSGMHVGMLQIAGLLSEHAANVLRTLLTTAVAGGAAIQSQPCKDCGIAHAGDCEKKEPLKSVGGGEYAS